ncbi:FAD-linked oxidoreductase ZEB1 [Lingula anatina]|uniref:FAD-linked oxidoreductase ZEB1 n=1 Tax=Lingula anatina TaxID=7574 RepID=A0A1S3KGG1_LINAN|nr:FAD-linked oxidoreductase ZEB1 [Lingula anatina]|eukprot:XP_013421321.1 FAD-linked oxidoreductase ZEB1 [Lingula anatina]
MCFLILVIRLVEIKRRWDPYNWFSCHHCVASDLKPDPIDVLERGGRVITEYCQPDQSCWPSVEEIEAFCRTIYGECVLPGEPFYRNATIGTIQPERWVANPGLIIYIITLQDIQKSVIFASRFNIRISVITSGHDFIGRNTADGSLQINLSRLKYLFVDLNDASSDTGMSCVTDVGNNWAKLYEEVTGRYNKLIVGGNSGTVSPAGFTLGGGKSLLSKMFGLAVDNVLEFTIVNAQGQIVHVYPTHIVIEDSDMGFTRVEDPDLFWALRGGGGGTFAIVTRVKYRLFEPPSGGFTTLRGLYPFQTDQAGNNVVANEVLDFMFSYIRGLPQKACGYVLVDSPYRGSEYMNVSATMGQIYIVIEYFGGEAEALPTLNTLYNYRPDLKLHDYKPVHFNTFWEMRKDNLYTGYRGRTYMFSTVVPDGNLNREFADMMVRSLKEVERMGLIMECEGAVLGGKMREYADNSSSVVPGFRRGLMTWSCGAFWFENENNIEDSRIDELQTFHQRLLKAGSGVYLNEASDILDDWKQLQWGANYPRLLEIKKKWDPRNIFTCHHCVGSDQVTVN